MDAGENIDEMLGEFRAHREEARVHQHLCWACLTPVDALHNEERAVKEPAVAFQPVHLRHGDTMTGNGVHDSEFKVAFGLEQAGVGVAAEHKPSLHLHAVLRPPGVERPRLTRCAAGDAHEV